MTKSAIRFLSALSLAAVLLGAVCGLQAGDKDKFVWKDGKWVKQAKPGKGTVEGEIALIRDYLEKGKDGDALKAAEEFLKNRTDAPEREEAMMLGGKAEMARGNYYNAYEWLERQLSNYPGGTYSERALDMEYQIAEAYLQGRKRRAMKIFRLPAEEDGLVILGKIPEHAPSTAIAEKALIRIADQHWTKQRWAKAADGYDQYLALFAKGSQAGYAMFQAARATYASYRGEKYDDTALIDADQRFKTYLKQFPQEAENNKVNAILKDIAEKRARKLFSTASFYERTGKRPSAKYYYKQLADKYPNSDYASKARAALKKLGDVKAEPDKLSRPLTKKLTKAEKPLTVETTADQLAGKGRPDYTDEPDESPKPAPETRTEKPENEKPAEGKQEKPVHLEELAPELPAGRPDYTDEPKKPSEPEVENPPDETSEDGTPAESENENPVPLEELAPEPKEGRADA